MSIYNLDRSKIRPEHHERAAFVYIRQSSLKQVRENLESQKRQYGFAEQARAMGWNEQQVVVVDEDQGKSGATPESRPGFARLISAVARSEVGIVMSLEVSRLSRNDADWYHLVHLCRWTGTLIADEQGIYDPSAGADRMVLGIRGQVSEIERDNSVHRMVEARWNKARRGEVFTMVPAGYDLDEIGRLSITSDQAVADAIRRVFDKFDEVGTARQVLAWWHAQGLPFPVRRLGVGGGLVVWTEVKYRAILSTLHHPFYAGAYVFGRSETRRELDPDNPHRVVIRRGLRRGLDEWPVLINDHHPGYITFDKYLANQARIENNEMMKASKDESHTGAAREGQGLLPGLARCGHCGRRMFVGYGGAKARRTLQYRCRWPGEYGRKECQLVGGKRIEAVVVATFLEVTKSAGSRAAVLADQQLRGEIAATEKLWQLQIEKAEYEARLAERQYMATDPENRTVARELERRWNQRLEELETVRTKAAQALDHRRPLSAAELVRAEELGRNLDEVWQAETTTMRDRKRLLRSVIEEVQIRTEQKRYLVRIVWKGGATTEREVLRLASPGGATATPLDTVELVRQLAQEFDDSQIARILNRQRRRSGLGRAFTKESVGSLRGKNKIPAAPKKQARDDREGPFTLDQTASELGVAAGTVQRWLRDGVLAGHQSVSGAPWSIVLTEEVRRKLAGGEAPAGWVGLSEAARRLGLGKSQVVYLVKQGKLQAMRTQIGKRECWRIDVSSATCGRQRDLFDQMIGGPRRES
jgi:DNA invertase Pin-like site-specific DNA recombinase